MKERAIIFNAEMVRAVLQGRKTQTRRIIKDCPTVQDGWYPDRYNNSEEWTFWGPRGSADAGRCTLPFVKSPFGDVGDRLWVRETFRVMGRATDVARLMYKASERNSFTESTRTVPVNQCNKQSSYNWTPSIHMPRWASRITLEITGVRVERLQAISEADARSEGILWSDGNPNKMGLSTELVVRAKNEFVCLWDSIYGADSWQANPWVWVIEFKHMEGD